RRPGRPQHPIGYCVPLPIRSQSRWVAPVTRPRRPTVPTFIAVIKFTEQGLKNIRDTHKRADNFKAAARKRGAKVTDVYWALGAFDGVVIFDAPDDETAA